MTINVMVVDDHKIVRTGISRLLQDFSDINVVAEADSGEEARRLVRIHDVDVVLMDINMPGMGGLEATKRLISAHPGIKIIALSMYIDGPYPASILKAGASGYLSKNAEREEVVNAVRRVYAGDVYITPNVALNIIFTGNVDNEDFLRALSKRELQVLHMISKGQKPKQISEQLSISETTVRTHRRHLFEKLGVRSDVELAGIASKYGLGCLSENDK